MTDKKRGIAIIGCGDIGWPNADAVHKSSDAYVSAAYDPNLAVSQDLARKYHTNAYETYEALLEDKDTCAVLLSVPHHLHVPLAEQAARAGKHVLIEKPLANTSVEGLSIIRTCKECRVKLTVNFSFRYNSVNSMVKDLIESGAIGSLEGVNVNHLMNKGSAYWSGGFHGRTPDNWRTSKEKAGGGILIMGLVHSLDYMEHLTKSRIVKVYAEYQNHSVPGDVEDTITLVCRFDNSMIGTWCASTHYHGKPHVSETIWGSEGSIILKPAPAGIYLARRKKSYSPGRFHRFKINNENAFRSIWIDRFVQSIREDAEPEISWRDGLHLTRVVEGAYESQKQGKPIDIDVSADE